MFCTCNMDTAIGPVFLLQRSLNDENCRIVQPVHTNLTIDKAVLKDMKMATFNLEVPPIVAAGDEAGMLIFEFDADTVEDTILGLLELIFEEYTTRVERHQWFKSTGPSIAVYAEPSSLR